ncbi:MAG: ATP-binding protein [Methanomassiliicoccus sp.]|nr:ATP-binding protein [Methanomassiliicoccus sp.]
MEWIVLGEKNGKIRLVSKNNTNGILPKGSYLTIELTSTGSKFILRVDDTEQSEPYSPSPLIVDMDLSPLKQDQMCQNIISAYRVRDIYNRSDGLIDFIPPQSIARRSTQAEVDLALGGGTSGPKVFVATLHSSQNQLLKDESGKHITATLPVDMFFHQVLVCGKTGSGKTVATKYLAQYFTESLEGAVLAINVKDVDFLKMDCPSRTTNPAVVEEWETLGEHPRGVENYTIYYPANIAIDTTQKVTPEVCQKITLDVTRIEPEALTGLLEGISDTASMNFPNIFRHWQEEQRSNKNGKFTFGEFVLYFSEGVENGREFPTMNSRGDSSFVTLHKGTCDNIIRNLDYALDFFDNKDAKCIDETDILVPNKMSIINVAGNKGIQFGSILLRDLLHRIVDAKDKQRSRTNMLIIIDEVHQFYNTDSSREALGDLDTICRTGRSKKIGVIFSSQNPTDIPRGLANVINTKIFFKSDANSAKSLGLRVTDDEMESLRKGFAVASIHELSQLKVLKFPLSYSGVFEKE